jgi:hypothetical protein
MVALLQMPNKETVSHLGFNNFQVLHLDSTGGEVWNFTLALRRLARTTHASPKPSRHATTSFIVTLNRWKANFGAH